MSAPARGIPSGQIERSPPGRALRAGSVAGECSVALNGQVAETYFSLTDRTLGV